MVIATRANKTSVTSASRRMTSESQLRSVLVQNRYFSYREAINDVDTENRFSFEKLYIARESMASNGITNASV